jgi:hypothetical protein
MGKPSLVALVAVLSFGIASTAKAQRAGSVASTARSVSATRRSGYTRTSHSFSGVRLNSKSTGSSSASSHVYLYKPGTTAALPNTLPAIGGSGFDCEYLGCSGGANLGTEALINPATQAQLALAARFRRIGGLTGVYLLGGGYPYDYEEPEAEAPAEEQAAPQQPAPQIIVIQQPSPNAQSAQPSEAAAAPEPEVVPDVGDFTLILKSGTEITAVAFTRRNDQLVYITRAGARRTVNVADVDVTATTKANEDRGTPFKLPI